jgi:hypothetical protein
MKGTNEYTDHQFDLFKFNDVRPKGKVPISRARVEEVKRLIELRKGHEAAIVLREIREKLEHFLSRIK